MTNATGAPTLATTPRFTTPLPNLARRPRVSLRPRAQRPLLLDGEHSDGLLGHGHRRAAVGAPCARGRFAMRRTCDARRARGRASTVTRGDVTRGVGRRDPPVDGGAIDYEDKNTCSPLESEPPYLNPSVAAAHYTLRVGRSNGTARRRRRRRATPRRSSTPSRRSRTENARSTDGASRRIRRKRPAWNINANVVDGVRGDARVLPRVSFRGVGKNRSPRRGATRRKTPTGAIVAARLSVSRTSARAAAAAAPLRGGDGWSWSPTARSGGNLEVVESTSQQAVLMTGELDAANLSLAE